MVCRAWKSLSPWHTGDKKSADTKTSENKLISAALPLLNQDDDLEFICLCHIREWIVVKERDALAKQLMCRLQTRTWLVRPRFPGRASLASTIYSVVLTPRGKFQHRIGDLDSSSSNN